MYGGSEETGTVIINGRGRMAKVLANYAFVFSRQLDCKVFIPAVASADRLSQNRGEKFPDLTTLYRVGDEVMFDAEYRIKYERSDVKWEAKKYSVRLLCPNLGRPRYRGFGTVEMIANEVGYIQALDDQEPEDEQPLIFFNKNALFPRHHGAIQKVLSTGDLVEFHAEPQARWPPWRAISVNYKNVMRQVKPKCSYPRDTDPGPPKPQPRAVGRQRKPDVSPLLAVQEQLHTKHSQQAKSPSKQDPLKRTKRSSTPLNVYSSDEEEMDRMQMRLMLSCSEDEVVILDEISAGHESPDRSSTDNTSVSLQCSSAKDDEIVSYDDEKKTDEMSSKSREIPVAWQYERAAINELVHKRLDPKP